MSPEQFDAIIAAVRAGKPVRKAIATADVSAYAFYARLDADPASAERYARAKEAQLEALADEMVAIADDSTGDTYEDGDGGIRIAPDVVQRARLRVDTRKWLLSKLAPKRYGDKVEHAGPDGGAIKVEATVRVAYVDTPAEGV